MKKTIDINITGQLFRIDEEAWKALRHYLDHVSARFSSEPEIEETMHDIEARIAEIFGGGGDPPTLITREMVREMVNIMGAPEDYYDEVISSPGGNGFVRKSMYDPSSLSARTGKALSDFFTAFGKMMSGIFRIIAVILGGLFTVAGFILLFSFGLLIFFSNTPFLADAIHPAMTNIHTLLSIVLNVRHVWPVLILASLVILIPPAALTWLGIKMIFRIWERHRLVNIIGFVIWIASLCALAVILAMQLSLFSNRKQVEQLTELDPLHGTLWIASGKTVSDLEYDRFASVERTSFYVNSSREKISATVNLFIHGTDDNRGYLNVVKRGYSNSAGEARQNAMKVEYNWQMRGDTLYLDEYFSLPSGQRWSGSMVNITLKLPEGTRVRLVPGTSTALMSYYLRDPERSDWLIREGRLAQHNVQQQP